MLNAPWFVENDHRSGAASACGWIGATVKWKERKKPQRALAHCGFNGQSLRPATILLVKVPAKPNARVTLTRLLGG
jgi:hypothetical protein